MQQIIDANLARAGRLRHPILHQAFSGRLVPQPTFTRSQAFYPREHQHIEH